MTDTVTLNNRYLLQERIGSGGMAVVYRAQDQMLERTVALKLLKKDFSTDPAFRERFRQEAKAAANLSHPNIVTIYDFGYGEEQLFIIMEYVPGQDLKTIMKDQGSLEFGEALSLMIQACAGIGSAHRSGLVHCDIKPQNMLVTPDGRLKVVDFGIARAMASIRPDEKHQIVWGSPQYFSPEQASGAPPSPASDVYSLGIVLFEAVTGQPPFRAVSAEELSQMHRETLPPSPRQLNPNIPHHLESIILKTLSKNPANRHQTAVELGEAITASIFPTGTYLTADLMINGAETNSLGGAAPGGTAIASKTVVPATATTKKNQSLGFDWVTWILALIALIAIGGLIPFWLWVYYLINPPV